MVNSRVEIARPIGTLFITPETGAQMRRCDQRTGRTFSQHREDWTNLLDTLTYYELRRDVPARYHALIPVWMLKCLKRWIIRFFDH